MWQVVGENAKGNMIHNNAINSDSEKRRYFVAPLFTASYGERWIS
jgi:hypothetical protein